MTTMLHKPEIKVADEVWVATALLHYRNPQRQDFSSREIEAQVAEENIYGEMRPGIAMHVSTHAVAGKQPYSGKYRMLTEVSHGRRRLFRDGDEWHPDRDGKVVPHRDELPLKYHYLLDWYGEWSKSGGIPLTASSRMAASGGNGPRPPFPTKGRFDGLLRLRGTWTAGDPDEFVRKMREE